jgi:hypothetical protein
MFPGSPTITHWIGPANAEACSRQATAASKRESVVDEMRIMTVAFTMQWSTVLEKRLSFNHPAPAVPNKWPNAVKRNVNLGLQGRADVDRRHSFAGKPASIPYFPSN